MVFKLTPDCQSRIASGRLPGLLEVTLQQAFQTAAVTSLVAGHLNELGIHGSQEKVLAVLCNFGLLLGKY